MHLRLFLSCLLALLFAGFSGFAQTPPLGNGLPPSEPAGGASSRFWQLTFSYDEAGLTLLRAAQMPRMNKPVRTPGLDGALVLVEYQFEWRDAADKVVLTTPVTIPLGGHIVLPEVGGAVTPSGAILPEGAFVVRVEGPADGTRATRVRLVKVAAAAGLTMGPVLPQLPAAFLANEQSFALPRAEMAALAAGPVSATKVRDVGADANRFVIAILSDGFTEANLNAGLFAAKTTGYVNTLLGISPWNDYTQTVNVWRVDIVSNESGADYEDAAPASGGTLKDTYLNAQFWTGGTQRLLALSGNGTSRAFAAADALIGVGVWDSILVFVNSPVYGGSGGSIGVSSVNSSADEIQLHEFGHSFAGLADEYDYGSTNTTCNTTSARNVDCATNFPNVKWNVWVTAGTPIPTPETSTYTNAIGAFEGASYQTTGMFRPKQNCRMNSLGVEFCPVCKEAHVLRLFTKFQMLDAAAPAIGTVDVPAGGVRTIATTPIPVAGLSYQWSLADAPIAGETGSSVSISAAQFSGTPQLKLDVTHTTALVRAQPVVQSFSWSLRTVSEPGITIGDPSVVEGDAGTRNLVFPVQLSFPPAGPVSVQFATGNGTAAAGSDYVSTSGTLDFVANQETASIVVTVNSDGLAEANETLFVALSNPVGATLYDAQGTGTISNDDFPPTISFTSPAGGEVNIPAGVGLILEGVLASNGGPGPLTSAWSKVSGPGTVTFGDAAALATTAQFSASGSYVLRLTGADALAVDSVDLTVGVGVKNQTFIPSAVGAQAVAPRSEWNAGLYTLVAAGAGLPSTGTPDDFFYLQQSTTGNVTLTARVVSIQNVSGSNSRAGVMIRESLAADAREVFVGANSQASGRFLTRTTTGANSVSNAGAPASTPFPYWMRLIRSGNVFTAQFAPDVAGTPGSWTTAGTPTVAMSTTAFAGLAASSGSTTNAGAATFDHVTITPNNANIGPLVNAGPDLGATTSGMLAGSVSDDALPIPPAATGVMWSKMSGPGAVTFANASSAAASANFGASGAYTLRLTADDGHAKTFDEMTLSIVVPDLTLNSPGASDIGLPAGVGLLLEATATNATSTLWSQLSGPGAVTFGDATAASTSAQFSGTGTYALQLAAASGAGVATRDLTVRVLPAAALAWTGAKIGTYTVTPSFTRNASGVFTIVSGGNGTASLPSGGTADAFHLIHKPLTGDLAITARVVSVQNVSASNSRAGVMIRESLTTDARHAFAGLTSQASGRFITRASPGAASASITVGAALPYWVRLTRSGDDFTAAYAPDAAGTPGAWTEAGTQTVAMGASVFFGLAATSGSSTTPGSAVIDHLTMTPWPANIGPLVETGADRTISTATAALAGSASDDGLPQPVSLTTLWTTSGNGATFANAASLTSNVTFTTDGSRVLRLVAQDGQVKSFDDTTFNVTLPTPWNAWRTANFTAAELADDTISGRLADPEHDGLPNVIEYALSLNPKAADPAANLPAPGLENGLVTLTYRKNIAATDVTFSIEDSTLLTNWTPANVTEEILSTVGNLQTIKARTVVPVLPQYFLRLVITLP